MMLNRAIPLGFDQQKALRLMEDKNLSGLLITSPENVYYTTGYPAVAGTGNPILAALHNQLPYFACLDAGGSLTLVGWMAATNGVTFAVDDVRTFFNRSSALEELENLLKEKFKSGSVIGVESSCPLFAADLARGVAGSENLVVADALMTSLRLIKSPAEMDLIRRSTAIAEEVVSELAGVVRTGMTRHELIQDARFRIMQHGASGIDHLTVGFGSSNHEVEIEETLQPGQLVQLDIGASLEGYVSDNRRILYSGTPVPDDIRTAHEKVCAIIDEMALNLVPGNTFAQIFNMAFELFMQNDLTPFFMNAGHSMGLQTEEVWLDGEHEEEIQPGMVLNLEVYTAHLSGELIGDEETYFITAEGPERITTLPRAIQSVP